MPNENFVSIPFGIIVGLLASCVQSLGLTIQRKSHVQNQSLPEHLQRVEHRRPLWLLGFVVFISSNILGSFVQIASLPVVILAPLGAVSLLWNAFFARLLLGDLFSPWMVLGTIFIAGGAILIAVFGIVPEQTRSLEDLLALFTRPTFIVYFSILGFVTVVCLAITHLSEFSLNRRIAKECPSETSSVINLTPSATHVNLPTHTANVTTGISEEINDVALATERTPLLDRKSGTATPTGYTPTSAGAKHNMSINNDPVLASINRTRVWLAISYASFSGIISGMCLLFAKSGVELLLLTLKGHNQFWRWEAWCLVLGLIVFALLQLWYLHKALVLAAPTLVCPSAFCFYNLSSIVNGLVYFDQFALIRPLYLGLVSLGIAVLLGGVWVVSVQSTPVDEGSWDEDFIDISDEESLISTGTEPAAATEIMPLTQQPSTARQASKRKLGPITMRRETRSESNVPNIDSEAVGLGLGLPRLDESAGGSITNDAQLSTSPESEDRIQRSETQLYPTPRKPSGHSQRRTTDDSLRITTTSSQHHLRRGSRDSLARAVSYSHHPNAEHRNTFLQHSHTILSPVGGGGSTFGGGFQIGLSPVSPGFNIFPSERRRGSAYGPSLMEVVNGAGAVGGGRSGKARRDMRRRRTVSEGQITRRDLLGDEEGGEVAGQGVMDVDERRDEGVGRRRNGEGDNGEHVRARGRWKWLRRMINRTTDKN
ncbi:hypothetical protein CPB83DRAFT_857899 [Crepidotus variabilis]|uniref:Uncharacterized protein n=1 Tax=Crepidotus variabilis TaxID=179855 RepID=A0A9P6JMN0_9AGAR|nr:hypothetical protein CPB83DRAFT_857899 [Crepidotus variabilis]